MFFPPCGKYCDINFPVKWKKFSTGPVQLVPDSGQLLGNSLRLSRSTFGIAIAKEGVTVCNAESPSIGEYGPVHPDASDSEEPLVLPGRSFCMESGDYWRALCRGVPSCARRPRKNLVGEPRFFPRFPGPHLCGVSGVGYEKNPSRETRRSYLKRNCRRGPGAGGPAPG